MERARSMKCWMDPTVNAGKIRADLQRNLDEEYAEGNGIGLGGVGVGGAAAAAAAADESVNRLDPRYSHGVSSPGRHVRTRLYFTSESHLHSLLTVLRCGGLVQVPYLT